MAIKGVLDLQRRSLPLGEIRIGESEPVPGKKYRKPVRRETFLFTTPVEETAQAIAAKFGGTVVPWDRRAGYWAVGTDRKVIEVWVPPRGLAVDAWMEMWDGGKCRRRCDGITEQRSGQPCMCPQPQDRTDPADVARAANERKHLAALTPPQGCKPITRINVQIPGLPGVTGVWVLRTGSANAAVETADTGEVLERARSMDVYLPALVLIHWRPGQDGHPYPVLTLRLRPSAEQIAQLPAGRDGMLAQLDGGNRLALTAGSPAAQHPAPRPVIRSGATGAAAERPAPPVPHQPEPSEAAREIAQKIADDTANATTREEVGAYIQRAKSAGALEIDVDTRDDGEITIEPLRGYLDARWRALPAAGSPRAPQRPAPSQDGSLFADDPEWETAS